MQVREQGERQPRAGFSRETDAVPAVVIIRQQHGEVRGAARRGGGQGRAGGVLHGRPRSARGPAAKKAEERFVEVFVGGRPGFHRRLLTR